MNMTIIGQLGKVKADHDHLEAEVARFLKELGRTYPAPAERELLAPRYSPVPGCWDAQPLCPEIDEIAAGSFRQRMPPEIRGRGHVVRSLEAALWAFHHGGDFREAVLLAVNLGEDADTTGAICGQIAGAFHGERGIPEAWLERLHQRELITSLADGLLEASQR